MAVILKYGPVNFQIGELSKFEEALQTIYSEQPAVAVKPLLDHTGLGLKTIDVELVLHSAVGDVSAQSDLLEAIQEEASAHSLTWGSGRDLGKFVIASTRKNIIKTHADGLPYFIKYSVSFLEYLEDNTTAPKLKPGNIVSRASRPLAMTSNQKATASLAQSSGTGLTAARRSVSSVSNAYKVTPTVTANALAGSQTIQPGTLGTMVDAANKAAPRATQTGLPLSGVLSLAVPLLNGSPETAAVRLVGALDTMHSESGQTALAELGIAGGNMTATTALLPAALAPLTPTQQTAYRQAIYGDGTVATTLLAAASDGSLVQNQTVISSHVQREIRHRAIGA